MAIFDFLIKKQKLSVEVIEIPKGNDFSFGGIYGANGIGKGDLTKVTINSNFRISGGPVIFGDATIDEDGRPVTYINP